MYATKNSLLGSSSHASGAISDDRHAQPHTHTHTHNRTRTRTYVAGVGGGLGLPGLVKLNLSNMHLNDEHLVHVASTHLISAGRPLPILLSISPTQHSFRFSPGGARRARPTERAEGRPQRRHHEHWRQRQHRRYESPTRGPKLEHLIYLFIGSSRSRACHQS
jgi:hypothetical protein